VELASRRGIWPQNDLMSACGEIAAFEMTSHGSESVMVTKIVGMCLLLGVVAVAGQDLAADTRALMVFSSYHDPEGVKLNWTNATSPCSWVVITCSNNRVTEVRLPGKGFRGIIPPGSLGSLSALQVVSLRGNRLSAQFPGELANCHNLQQLYLAGNEFYGSLPNLSAFWPQLNSLGLEYNRLVICHLCSLPMSLLRC
jgi:hypothetical protein